MLLQVKAGRPVHPIFVHSGGVDQVIREAEASEAAEFGGFERPVFLRYDAVTINNVDDIAVTFGDLIDSLKPDAIFCPFILDADPAHGVTNLALAMALKKTGCKCRVYGYEVWSLCIANIGIAIDEVIEKKKELIAKHKSQVLSTDYVNSTIGLNSYHSRTFSEKNSRFVENYFELPSAEFINAMATIAPKLWPDCADINRKI